MEAGRDLFAEGLFEAGAILLGDVGGNPHKWITGNNLRLAIRRLVPTARNH